MKTFRVTTTPLTESQLANANRTMMTVDTDDGEHWCGFVDDDGNLYDAKGERAEPFGIKRAFAPWAAMRQLEEKRRAATPCSVRFIVDGAEPGRKENCT